jgi:hypothetical protein
MNNKLMMDPMRRDEKVHEKVQRGGRNFTSNFKEVYSTKKETRQV